MNTKKTIVVVGSTGAQGGGLVRAILNDPNHEFNVRAITTDINSDKAKELVKLGAEVVAANLDDADSIKKAFNGAYGAFCVTFFWNHFSPEKEMAHAKVMAEAASYAKIKHVIWSTLDDTSRVNTKYPILMQKASLITFLPVLDYPLPFLILLFIGIILFILDWDQRRGQMENLLLQCQWETRSFPE